MQGNPTDREEGCEGTRICQVASMPGPALRGGFPHKVGSSGTTDLLRSAVHPEHGQCSVRGIQTSSGVSDLSLASSLGVPSITSQPEDDGPGPEAPEPMESALSTSDTSQRVKEQVTTSPNSDSDKADEPTPERESPPQGLQVKLPRTLRKRGSKAATSSSKNGATPSKVQKELEADDAEATASTGPSEATLQTAWFELYDKDLPEVKEVCAKILGLDEG